MTTREFSNARDLAEALRAQASAVETDARERIDAIFKNGIESMKCDEHDECHAVVVSNENGSGTQIDGCEAFLERVHVKLFDLGARPA